VVALRLEVNGKKHVDRRSSPRAVIEVQTAYGLVVDSDTDYELVTAAGEQRLFTGARLRLIHRSIRREGCKGGIQRLQQALGTNACCEKRCESGEKT
jgi:hypothetical protein